MRIRWLWGRADRTPLVRCVDCGCLVATPEEREALRSAEGWLGVLGPSYCVRVAKGFEQCESREDWALWRPDETEKYWRFHYLRQHKCDLFIEHVPGLTPKEHIQLDLAGKAERERRKWERSQKAFWLAIGGLLTLLVQLVAAALVWYFGFRG